MYLPIEKVWLHDSFMLFIIWRTDIYESINGPF